jgi:hypothetical protein
MPATRYVMVAMVALMPAHVRPTDTIHVERHTYTNGMLAEERAFSGTREQGVHRGWWPNGQPRFEYSYRDGTLNGVSREWFPSGALWREQRYEAGHEAGLQRMYWEDGRVRASYVVRGARRFGLLGAKGCVTRDSVATDSTSSARPAT